MWDSTHYKSSSFPWTQGQTSTGLPWHCRQRKVWEWGHGGSREYKDLENNEGQHWPASWITKASLTKSIHANRDENLVRQGRNTLVHSGLMELWHLAPFHGWGDAAVNGLHHITTCSFCLLRRILFITEHRANRRSKTLSPVPILTTSSQGWVATFLNGTQP